MYVLTIRTDKEVSEVGVYKDGEQLAYQTWQAHRELAETLHTKIIDVLQEANVRLHELQAIIAYKGPGSFTGLRIGLSVANALAYSLGIAVVAENGDDWITSGLRVIGVDKDQTVALPEYGADPHITKPKH